MTEQYLDYPSQLSTCYRGILNMNLKLIKEKNTGCILELTPNIGVFMSYAFTFHKYSVVKMASFFL